MTQIMNIIIKSIKYCIWYIKEDYQYRQTMLSVK